MSSKVIGDKNLIKKDLVTSILKQFLPQQLNAEELISLHTDKNGCPFIISQLPIHLEVSFSYCQDKLWSVVAIDTPVGIDVESPDSFTSDYPFDLILNKNEQNRLAELSSCTHTSVAAMWSCKEAAVKCRKSGFGDIGPLDLHIGSITRTEDRFIVEVKSNQHYTVLLEKEGTLWRAVASQTN